MIPNGKGSHDCIKSSRILLTSLTDCSSSSASASAYHHLRDVILTNKRLLISRLKFRTNGIGDQKGMWENVFRQMLHREREVSIYVSFKLRSLQNILIPLLKAKERSHFMQLALKFNLLLHPFHCYSLTFATERYGESWSEWDTSLSSSSCRFIRSQGWQKPCHRYSHPKSREAQGSRVTLWSE
jgi:hypothetical protein